MDWIYLSPHYDDIALSCAGLVWDQAAAGDRASVWTICAGLVPPGRLSPFAQSLHDRWQTGNEAVEQRKNEDIASCQVMNASFYHFDLPDCIYRSNGEHYYASEEAIFGEIHPAEFPLVQSLAKQLDNLLPVNAQVVCPLGLGGHVDHRLTRAAAEMTGRPLFYYPDYPYVLKESHHLETLAQSGWVPIRYNISAEGITRWQAAIAAHSSQISTFWSDLTSMRQAVKAYRDQIGLNLWQKKG